MQEACCHGVLPWGTRIQTVDFEHHECLESTSNKQESNCLVGSMSMNISTKLTLVKATACSNEHFQALWVQAAINKHFKREAHEWTACCQIHMDKQGSEC